MRKLLCILAVVFLVVINTAPVMADVMVVTVLGVPNFTTGITSFTVTYIKDTEIDLNWTYDATVSNVMVRAKYGSYATNPPNDSTAPSDGYLVYYGSGLSAVDTSMNFDNNPDTLYYSIWGQKGDGSWYLIPSTGSKESKQMILLFLGLISLGIMGAGFGFKKSWILWMDIPFWLVLSIYIAYNETWFAATAQHSLILLGIGATFGLGYSAIRMQAKPTTARTEPDEDMDEEDVEFQMEQAKYQRISDLYSNKNKRKH
jgi:hypothetical protein